MADIEVMDVDCEAGPSTSSALAIKTAAAISRKKNLPWYTILVHYF